MKASTRLLGFSRSLSLLLRSRHFLSPLRNPNPSHSLLKLPSCHRHCARAARFFSPRIPRRPFLSLSLPPHSLSSNPGFRCDRRDLDSDDASSLFDRGVDVTDGGDLGFCKEKGAVWTVVLLGWLGSEAKHLKRYAEMYNAKGIRSVRFVVAVKETVGLDLCKNVEERIDGLAKELVRWCSESERDGKERYFIFHTFSNTGWLIYGILLQNFQSRNDMIEKIKGCVVDSAPSADITPQVWAAGYCAALLKKRSRELDGKDNGLNALDIIPALAEVIVLKVLEIFFSLVLMLPYANKRLSAIISTLKDQPPCPQLYLYSSADKVIPASVVESFIREQKALGKDVHAHNFGSSSHVDHLRSFPHIYSTKVNEFLEHCCSIVVSKT